MTAAQGHETGALQSQGLDEHLVKDEPEKLAGSALQKKPGHGMKLLAQVTRCPLTPTLTSVATRLWQSLFWHGNILPCFALT